MARGDPRLQHVGAGLVAPGRRFEPFDGALPDPYLGIEPMLELFRRSADAAKAGLN